MDITLKHIFNIRFIRYIIVAIISCSCVIKPDKELSNNVILIFKDAPIQNIGKQILLSRSGFDPKECVTYLDSNINIVNLSPRNIGCDTVIIPTFMGYAEVKHKYMGHENIRYLFMKGDTILFTYDSLSRPKVTSAVSVKNTEIYNFPYIICGSILEKSGYSLVTTLLNDYYHTAYNVIRKKDDITSLFYKKCKEVYINMDSLLLHYYNYNKLLHSNLDSLYKHKIISKYQYDYYVYRISVDSTAIASRFNLKMGIDEFVRYNDSLSILLSYHETMMGNASRLYSRQNGKYNPLKGFDLIMADSTIPPISKKIMLDRIMDIIINGLPMMYTSSYNEELEYRQKYSVFFGHHYKNAPIISHTNIMENGYSNDFILKTVNGDVLNYGELIQRNKGKVIYVDFWASWCAPCKGEMPSSIKLHNEYQDKDVVFIYLAYNDKQAVWETALKECGISQFKENYIISNPQSAKFVKEIKLSTIPRFMLYNKEGKLINTDAPRPSSKEIKEAIDELLKENN